MTGASCNVIIGIKIRGRLLNFVPSGVRKFAVSLQISATPHFDTYLSEDFDLGLLIVDLVS